MAPGSSGPSVRARPRRRSGRHAGFTLLEAIVAIVMFTILMVAISQVFSVALQSSKRTQTRQMEDGSVRAVFDMITRDILAAYPSRNSPVSTFTTGGSSSSGGSMAGDLLSFSALSTRLQTPELDSQSSTGPQLANSTGEALPQSDMALVKYNFDSGAGKLYRMVSTVPSTQTLNSTAPSDDVVIANNLVNIRFEFWDATQGTWRSDWDYEQQNQIGVVPLSSIDTSAASSSSSSAGGSAAPSSSGQANTTATGDTTLPTAVRVTVTIAQSDGQSKDFVTTIPLGVTQTYIDPNQTANVNTTPLTTGTSAGTTTNR